jgi:hypothetical protein
LADKNLVGRCGLYWGACSIYRHHKDDGEYLKLLAEHFRCPQEKVRCSGCQALEPEDWGYECNIVQCLRGKGLEFCYQCGEYGKGGCEKFGKLAARYLEDGEDIRAGLERIKNGEAEAWLKECEEKYKCPKCGRPLPVGRMKRKCYHCSADLSKNTEEA